MREPVRTILLFFITISLLDISCQLDKIVTGQEINVRTRVQ